MLLNTIIGVTWKLTYSTAKKMTACVFFLNWWQIFELIVFAYTSFFLINKQTKQLWATVFFALAV